MQRKCIDLENEIRGLLKVFGVKLPMRLSRGAFDDALRDAIESDPAVSDALLPMLAMDGYLLGACRRSSRRSRQLGHRRVHPSRELLAAFQSRASARLSRPIVAGWRIPLHPQLTTRLC